jgi:hypothetical protein
MDIKKLFQFISCIVSQSHISITDACVCVCECEIILTIWIYVFKITLIFYKMTQKAAMWQTLLINQKITISLYLIENYLLCEIWATIKTTNNTCTFSIATIMVLNLFKFNDDRVRVSEWVRAWDEKWFSGIMGLFSLPSCSHRSNWLNLEINGKHACMSDMKHIKIYIFVCHRVLSL